MKLGGGPTRFSCKYCTETYKDSKGLKAHEVSHSEQMYQEKLKYREENFKCGFLIDIDAITGENIICENFTASVMALNDHQNSHMGYRPYNCDQCSLKFTTYNKRFCHINSVHKMKVEYSQIKSEDGKII